MHKEGGNRGVFGANYSTDLPWVTLHTEQIDRQTDRQSAVRCCTENKCQRSFLSEKKKPFVQHEVKNKVFGETEERRK